MAKNSKKKFTEPIEGKPFHENWMKRIELAKDFCTRHDNGWNSWKQGYQLYRGDHWSYMSKGQGYDMLSSDNPRNRITVNLIGSSVRTLMPFLLNRRPKFIAHPRLPEYVDNAKLQGSLLNYYWKEIQVQKQVEIALLDAMLTGHGIIETGWSYQPENPQTGEVLEYNENVGEDKPYVCAISPYCFYWDFESPSRDIDTSRWVIKAFFRNIEDVLMDERYDSNVRRKIRIGDLSPEEAKKFISLGKDDLLNQTVVNRYEDTDTNDRCIVLYEIFDKKFNEHLIYAGNCDEPLVREQNPYDYLDGFPFVKIDFIPAPHEPFAFGLPYWVLDQQFELNRIRTYQHDHIRRFNRKYEVVKSQLVDEEEGMHDLTEGKDGTMVFTKAPGSVIPIADAPMPADKYNMFDSIKGDIFETLGLDAMMRGGQLPSRTAATEINARTNIMSAKIDDYVTKVDGFVEELGKQILQHSQAYLSSETVVEVAGSEAINWIQIPRDKIASDFILDLESTSKPRTDPEMEKQQMIQLGGILVQLAQMGVPVNFFEWGKAVMEKLDIKEAFKIIPQNMPTTGAPVGAGAPQSGSPVGASQETAAEAATPQSAMAGGLGGYS